MKKILLVLLCAAFVGQASAEITSADVHKAADERVSYPMLKMGICQSVGVGCVWSIFESLQILAGLPFQDIDALKRAVIKDAEDKGVSLTPQQTEAAANLRLGRAAVGSLLAIPFCLYLAKKLGNDWAQYYLRKAAEALEDEDGA